MSYFDETTKAMGALNQQVQSGTKHAHEAGEAFSRMNEALLSVGNAAKLALAKVFWDVGTSYVKAHLTFGKEQLLQQQQGLVQHKLHLEALAERLSFLESIGEQGTEEYQLAEKGRTLAKEVLEVEQTRLADSLLFQKTLGATFDLNKRLVTVGLVFRALFNSALADARQYNIALIQTNSSYAQRYALIHKIYGVQRQIGAQDQVLAEAARSLADYGLEQESTYRENLKLVVMMSEGLGVAAHTGAELVVTFEKGLKQSARDVGDLIARVAAETGLAAQKAAQYAIEIARSLRLMGSMRSDATGVTKTVTDLASRIEELGGNSQVVSQIFRQMTGGSAQGFVLRGAAGVRVGELGTEAGSARAFEGLGRALRTMVSAGPGSELYVAQLEAASQYYSISTEDIGYYLQALASQHKQLTATQALQKAYTEQTQLTGQAWRQMSDALSTLYKRALLPFFQYVASPVLQGLADKIKWFADTWPAVTLVWGGLAAGALAATVAVTRLTGALLRFTATSQLATLLPGLQPISKALVNIAGQLRETGLWTSKSLLRLPLKEMATVLGGGAAGRWGLGMMLGGSGALVAALSYHVVGPLVNSMLPLSWRDNIGKWLYAVAVNTGLSVDYSKAQSVAFQQLTFGGATRGSLAALNQAAQTLAELFYKGPVDQSEVNKLFARSVGFVPGGPSGVQQLAHIRNEAERIYREMALNERYRTRTSAILEDDRKRDKALAAGADSLKEQMNQTVIQERVAASVEGQRRLLEAKEERDRIEELQRQWWPKDTNQNAYGPRWPVRNK